MIAQERYREIVRLVESRKRVSVASLQRRFGVSPAQLRRDLSHLESGRHLVRLHGAAVHPSFLLGESSHDARSRSRAAEKRRIAAAAAALVRDGDSVWIDAGTSCLEAALSLFARRGVRVMTHSVPVLSAALQAGVGVLSIGGEMRPVTGALVGAEAIAALDCLRPDWAFVGATGLSADGGLFTTELSEASVKARLLRLARQRVLLADSSKWEVPAAVRFGGWDSVDYLVTDAGLPASGRRVARGLCGQLVIAP